MIKFFCDVCGNEITKDKDATKGNLRGYAHSGFVFGATIGEEKKRVSIDCTPAIDGDYDVDVCEACIVNVILNQTIGADKS